MKHRAIRQRSVSSVRAEADIQASTPSTASHLNELRVRARSDEHCHSTAVYVHTCGCVNGGAVER